MAERGIKETVIVRAPQLFVPNGGLVLALDASLSQSHEYSCEVTAHPVEQGIDISDHVRRKPISLTIHGVIAHSPLGATEETPDAEANAWAMLEEMVGTVFDVTTSLRRYPSMVLRRAAVSRESGGGDGIEPMLELVEIRTVSRLTTALPPEQIKKTPQKANGPKQQELGRQPTATPDASKTAAAQRSSALFDLATGAGWTP